MKQLTVALVVACASAGAMAQQAGDNVATVGWFHIMPQDSSHNLTTSVINAPINDPLRLPGSFTSPNSGLRVSNANTLGLTLTHFFTDNIALTTIAGVPPEFKLTGHGVIRAPGLVQTDISVVRNFQVREKLKAQFRVELFNVFNHTNFGYPNVTADNAQFGTISSALDPRQSQFALKLSF